MTIELTTLQRILVFVGSPRTGSTLLGQLLNHHPDAMVANESALVPRLLERAHRTPIDDEALRAVAMQAVAERAQGLESTPRFGATIDRYQPRWTPMGKAFANVPPCNDRPLVVGDKKAGGAAKAIERDPAWFDGLMRAEPRLVLLHLTRDTSDAARSLQRSHDYDDPDEARAFVERLRDIASRTCDRHPERSITLAYETLTQDPRATLTTLAGFLGLEPHAPWLEAASRVIAPSGSA